MGKVNAREKIKSFYSFLIKKVLTLFVWYCILLVSKETKGALMTPQEIEYYFSDREDSYTEIQEAITAVFSNIEEGKNV